MEMINASDFKTHCLALLDRIQKSCSTPMTDSHQPGRRTERRLESCGLHYPALL